MAGWQRRAVLLVSPVNLRWLGWTLTFVDAKPQIGHISQILGAWLGALERIHLRLELVPNPLISGEHEPKVTEKTCGAVSAGDQHVQRAFADVVVILSALTKLVQEVQPSTRKRCGRAAFTGAFAILFLQGRVFVVALSLQRELNVPVSKPMHAAGVSPVLELRTETVSPSQGEFFNSSAL